jgi:hypothetical protein
MTEEELKEYEAETDFINAVADFLFVAAFVIFMVCIFV